MRACANYQWTYDAADRITQFVSPDGTSNYNYDSRGQLTGANNTNQANEAYSYDANGNRTNTGYQTGANNQLLSDGTYNYIYDNEGNRTSRTNIATGEVTSYSWDYHNRLTNVVTQNSSGAVTESVAYTYDAYDRRIAKVIDADGAGPATVTTERMVYDGNNIALTFDGTGAQTHRYLYGPGVDQVLADETPTSVNWALVDNQGSVRDVIDSNGQVLNHIVYDSYGQVTSETNASFDFRFGYTGRERDRETGLQYNRARYYDPSTGAFIGQDPIGFAAGDANLYRYVGNSPLIAIDPFGLMGTDLDAGRVATTGLRTLGVGLAVVGISGLAVAATPLTLTGLAVIGVGALGVSAISSAYRRSNQAIGAGNSNLGELFGAIGLDTFGLNGLVEGATGRELVSGHILCTDERSDLLGSGLGNAGTVLLGPKTFKGGQNLGDDLNNGLANNLLREYARATYGSNPEAGHIYIPGFTKHGFEQATNRSVSPESVLDSIKSPLKINSIQYDSLGRPSQRYIGRTAEVAINPESMKIVSINPTSSKKAARLIRQNEGQ